MTDEIKEDSPHKDKGLELGKDTPPDMGKGEELPAGKEGEETLPPDTGLGGEEKLSPELESLMIKKGFKNLDEFAKAYEASEKKQTELEKDARLRSFIPSEIPERPKIERTFTDVPSLTKEPFDMSREEFEDYQGKREQRFEEKMVAKYEDAEADKKWNREYRETMAVVNKDPGRFEELKPTLATLHGKYPDATLAEIYPVADDMEKAEGQRKKDGFIKEVFGPNADVDKIRILASKARPAVVSDAGGTGAAGGEKKKAEDVIWESIKGSDMRRDK